MGHPPASKQEAGSQVTPPEPKPASRVQESRSEGSDIPLRSIRCSYCSQVLREARVQAHRPLPVEHHGARDECMGALGDRVEILGRRIESITKQLRRIEGKVDASKPRK